MRTFFISTFSLLLGVIIFGVVISIVGVKDMTEALAGFSPWGIIPLILFTLAGNIVSARKWQYILNVKGIKIGLGPILKVWLIGYALGYLTPVVYIGGEFFRGYILGEKYNVPWRTSLASIFIDKISEGVIWITIIFVGATVFLLQPEASNFSKIISASISGMLFLGTAVILIYILIFRRTGIVYRFILKPFGLEKTKGLNLLHQTEEDLLDFFADRNRAHLLWMFKASILKYFLLLARNIFLIYYLIGAVSVSGGIMALGFLHFSYTLPIPGALGAQEAILSAVFSGIGFEASLGAVFSLLIRGAEIFMVVAGIYYLIRWGLSRSSLRLLKWLKI